MTAPIEYELTEDDYRSVLDASRPVSYMVFGGVEPLSPQENANRAWRAIGARLGFDWQTVRRGRDDKHFMAVPVAS